LPLRIRSRSCKVKVVPRKERNPHARKEAPMTANNRHYTQLSAREFAPIREALQDAPDVPRHILQHLDRLEERYARALEEGARWQANWAAATNQAQRDIAEAHARSADCVEH